VCKLPHKSDRGARAYKGSLWAEPPTGSMVRAPGQEVWGLCLYPLPSQAKSILSFGSANEAQI